MMLNIETRFDWNSKFVEVFRVEYFEKTGECYAVVPALCVAEESTELWKRGFEPELAAQLAIKDFFSKD